MSLVNMIKWFNAPAAHGQENWATDTICGEKEFMRVLARERARAERSDHHFSLVVFETSCGKLSSKAQTHLLSELNARMRTTDEAGWLRQNRIGAILHNAAAQNAWIFAKNIQMSMHSCDTHLLCKVYSYPPAQKNTTRSDGKAPEKKGAATSAGQQFNRDCPVEELQPHYYTNKMTRTKRCIDLLGSILGLIILSPLFILLWCVIKSVSSGPVIYKQSRIGLGGRPFTFLKFRTMTLNADTTDHRNYLSSLIKGGEDKQNCSQAMVKLDDNNCNIIPLGKLIRKTYLDELPQLYNVLQGDMSLIGPRPPIPYEVEEYQLWHTGRFDTTPGMTGLWQVSGKNRLTFEQMVRLDIQYTRKQSFWMDLKILLMTPMVIASELKRSLNRIKQLGIVSKEIKL